MISKIEMRRAFRKREVSLKQELSDSARQEELNTKLVATLKGFSGIWAAFQPMDCEPAILPALAQLPQIEWAFPRVEGNHLEFYIKTDGSLMPGAFGLLEPDPRLAQKVPLNLIEGFLVPGVAFDSRCRRLGRGRGFYDRTLHRASQEAAFQTHTDSAFKLGIAFDRQISANEIPVEPFDILMDGVLTESSYFGLQPVPLEERCKEQSQSERIFSWTRS
jgi:5-formyltetrahydrofolate cyclo-ligase